MTDKEILAQFQMLVDIMEGMATQMEGFATKDDLKGLSTSITSIENDLKGFATKDDLKSIATQMEDFATKDDLKSIATQMEGFATKDDVDTARRHTEILIENTITKRLDSLFDGYKLTHEKQYELEHETQRLRNRVDSLETRLSALESRTA